MSTNINISVGDNKLLDQARLQQNASRQAQLEKEANKRLAREAEINRVNALAAKGLDANGNPVTGAPSTALQIDRRPAANRFGDQFYVGHCWVFTKNSNPETTYQRWIDFNNFIPAIGGYRGSGTAVTEDTEYAHIPRTSFLCGNGSTGANLDLSIPNYGPPIPEPNQFTVSCTYTDSVNARIYRVGSLKVIANTEVNWGFLYFLLPAGKDKYVLVVQGSAMYGQSVGTHPFWNVEELPLAGRPVTGIYPQETDFGFARYWGQDTSFPTCPVPTATGYANYEIKTDYAMFRKTYICSNTSIREVSIPATLENILRNQFSDPYITSYGTNRYRNVTYQRNYWAIPFGGGDSSFIWNSGSLLSAGYAATIYTPEIFDVLNFYGEYTNTIKPIPTGVSWRIADLSKEGYSIYANGTYSPPYDVNKTAELYSNGDPLYYTNWPNKDEVPDFRTFDPYWDYLNLPEPKPGKAKLTFSPLRPSQTYQEGESVQLGCVYDWNDASYCQQQLLALGFTQADLTP